MDRDLQASASTLHPAGGCVCEDASGTCAYCRSVKAAARVDAVIASIEPAPILVPLEFVPEMKALCSGKAALIEGKRVGEWPARVVRTEEEIARAEDERLSWRNGWRV